jgi:hypothetical protein
MGNMKSMQRIIIQIPTQVIFFIIGHPILQISQNLKSTLLEQIIKQEQIYYYSITIVIIKKIYLSINQILLVVRYPFTSILQIRLT